MSLWTEFNCLRLGSSDESLWASGFHRNLSFHDRLSISIRALLRGVYNNLFNVCEIFILKQSNSHSLRRLVVGILPRRPKFDPKSVYMEWTQCTLGQLLSKYFGLPCQGRGRPCKSEEALYTGRRSVVKWTSLSVANSRRLQTHENNYMSPCVEVAQSVHYLVYELNDRRIEVQFPAGANIFLYSIVSRPDLAPI